GNAVVAVLGWPYHPGRRACPAWLTPVPACRQRDEKTWKGRYRGRVRDPPSAGRVEPSRWAGDECTRPRARTRTAQVIRHPRPRRYSRGYLGASRLAGREWPPVPVPRAGRLGEVGGAHFERDEVLARLPVRDAARPP